LYNFCALPACADGSHPMAGVVLDQSGNLYGTTVNGGLSDGGVSDGGVVFKLEPQLDGTWKQSTLYTFQSAGTGYGPVGLTVDSSGNLYVIAAGGSTGNGIILELVPQIAQ
jgi:streptogramin lyase